ncbi:MAG TPA: DegT/DnrJ/EryC1/StrS family aminotransferase [Bacteroidota bacterium]|nr:DegT/DnrJ/EryC1/StrS family aminotransferase [Bacteroidota bacterium]
MHRSVPIDRSQARISTIDLTYENQLIKKEFFESLSALYDSNELVSSPVVEELETQLATYCGTRYCCMTGGGTMSLQIAAQVLNIKEGDEIVVPANTFLASAVAMYHAGARVILADVDPNTWNLSQETVWRVLTPRTKAICLVHLYGNVADPREFDRFGLPVIEDASHAFGGTLNGRRVGSLGTVAGFSAGPIKGFGGVGQAGFITYNQDQWHRYIRGYVNNGQTARHFGEYVGHNFRIDALNALFLQKKLAVWEELMAKRKRLIAFYDQYFAATGIRRQARRSDAESSLWVYVIRVDRKIRDSVLARLRDRGIDALVQYTFTIDKMPMWNTIAARRASVPMSDLLTKEIISLPVHPGLSVSDAAYVAQSVSAAIEESLGKLAA